jgi:DNA-binding MarR family transcriptional regulator
MSGAVGGESEGPQPRLAEEIWRLLLEPGFSAIRDHVSSSFAHYRLSPAQALLLRELDRPVSQRILARRLGHDPSNVTALADALEARGLVERRMDAADRRVRTLVRTPAGERVKQQLDERLFQAPDALCSLTEREQQQLLRLLRKVFGIGHRP